MSTMKTNEVLEQLMTLLLRSFPAYLTYARPYATQQDQRIMEGLSHIVADQESLAERIGQAMYAAGYAPRLGEFPMDYTDVHDLGVEYLLRMAIAYQQQDIAEIEQCVDTLRLAPMAHALAEEALGMAKGHLESLRELTGLPV